MGLWKASAAPGIRGAPEHPWHHGNGIDYLRVVGQQDNPPVLPGGRGSSRQQLGEVNSLLEQGCQRWMSGRAGGRGRVTSGRGRQAAPGCSCAEAEHAVIETVLPSLNIWCECSPKIDHFLLPPQRKQCWKESQLRQGWCKEGSRSLAASH